MTGYSTLPPEKIKVEQGIVQGTIEDSLRVFKGIPFAAPPIYVKSNQTNFRWEWAWAAHGQL